MALGLKYFDIIGPCNFKKELYQHMARYVQSVERRNTLLGNINRETQKSVQQINKYAAEPDVVYRINEAALVQSASDRFITLKL